MDPVQCPCGHRTAPYGNLQCFPYPTGPVRGPCRIRNGALRTRKGIDTTRICKKKTARASYVTVRCPYGPLTGPHGLFTYFLRFLKPYGARKLMMHALKLYGPVRGCKIRTVLHGARTGPVSGRAIFVQNSLGTARTGPGSVMWLRH